MIAFVDLKNEDFDYDAKFFLKPNFFQTLFKVIIISHLQKIIKKSGGSNTSSILKSRQRNIFLSSFKNRASRRQNDFLQIFFGPVSDIAYQ